jgi:hypothetical protein
MNRILHTTAIRTHRLCAKYVRVHNSAEPLVQFLCGLDQLEAVDRAVQMGGIRTTVKGASSQPLGVRPSLNDPLVEKSYEDALRRI